MMKRINWDGANYKDWIGLSAAPVFWFASLLCFVMGLAFKTGTGIIIPGTTFDIAILFSFALGFANTSLQIVGNDTDKDELGMALLLMWGASYMLGIGSNVNFLYSVIGLSNPLLQFLVCWGLGMMIEVAPERLLVKFLRSIGVLGKGKVQQTNRVSQQNYQSQNTQSYQPQHQERPREQQIPREQRHEQMRRAQQQNIPPFLLNQNSKRK